MSSNTSIGSRLDEINESIRKYYLYTLTQQGVSVSESQCQQWMEFVEEQNNYTAWVAYTGTMHNNPLIPMRGKCLVCVHFFEENCDDTKDFISQLILYSKKHYDETAVTSGLIRSGIKSWAKVTLNAKRNRIGRSVFNSLKQTDTVYESINTADVFYSATYIYLLNKQIQKRSQQDSVYEGLCAYQFFMDEKNDRFLNLFK